MAYKYLLEDGSGGYELEDASGVLLLNFTTPVAYLSGTIIGVVNADIVTGGKTIILTLENTEWITN